MFRHLIHSRSCFRSPFFPSKSHHAIKRLCSSRKATDVYDICIIGGGILGSATALEISQRFPNLKLCVLEKEDRVAQHQSGHNSGVVHAGIYYQPGSLKAQLCVEGLKKSYEYFQKNDIPYKKCGKLIVAVETSELGRLDDLYQRGLQNGVPNLEMVDGQDIQKYEPYCKGVKAIWSPETGIVDWELVTKSYVDNFCRKGGVIKCNFNVVNIFMSPENLEVPVTITNDKGEEIRSKFVLTCGGLQSDRLAQMTGCQPEPKIVPFRGEYLLLNPQKAGFVKGLIYPVPDPRFPFLGVHFTTRMDGSVWLGPNAVMAFKREGYRWRDIDFTDMKDFILFPGFWKLASKYLLFGMKETARSAFIKLQLKELRKFIPDINGADLSRGPAGVRAQAMDSSGALVDDFVFDSGDGALQKHVLHVRNAPSPGATSSLAIARMVVDRLQKAL